MILSGLAAIFSVLSAIGSLSIAFYLYLKERHAPNFIWSIKNGTGKRVTRFVSVIVTAKDEERVIAKCVSTLINQTYTNFEIIVVDDGSKDKTVSIVQELRKSDGRIRLVEAGEKPGGWMGKSWPCQTGFENSRGEILLFVDADSSFDPRVLEFAINYLESSSFDMFSISPRVNLHGPWSYSIVPLLSGGIDLLYPMSKVNNPEEERAYVFGTFILVRRNVYTSIGGHEKVKDRLVEDAAIAHLAKSSGFKLRVERGGDLVRTEWETEFWNVFHGIERVFSDSIRPYGLLSVLNALLVFFLGVFPLLVILGYLLAALGQGTSFALSSVAVVAVISSVVSAVGFLVNFGRELKQVSGRLSQHVLLYPLGCVVFMVAIISASIKISRGGTFEWKGSRYSQRESLP